RRSDGARVYDDAVLTRLVPVLYILGGSGPIAPGSALATSLAGFARQAGLASGGGDETVEGKGLAWLEADPLPRELFEELKQFLVERRTASAGRAAAMFGTKSSFRPGPAPSGSTKAGPLARFNVKVPETEPWPAREDPGERTEPSR